MNKGRPMADPDPKLPRFPEPAQFLSGIRTPISGLPGLANADRGMIVSQAFAFFERISGDPQLMAQARAARDGALQLAGGVIQPGVIPRSTTRTAELDGVIPSTPFSTRPRVT